MQAVVDSGYLFYDIVIGWLGHVHDARVLSNSELHCLGNNNSFLETYQKTMSSVEQLRSQLY